VNLDLCHPIQEIVVEAIPCCFFPSSDERRSEFEKSPSSTSVVSGGVLIGRNPWAEVGPYHSRDMSFKNEMSSGQCSLSDNGVGSASQCRTAIVTELGCVNRFVVDVFSVTEQLMFSPTMHLECSTDFVHIRQLCR
jgi:hypothetical protein